MASDEVDPDVQAAAKADGDAEVELVFEGDADAVVDVPIVGRAWLDDHPDHGEATSQVVGADRLAQVVTVVADTVEQVREQRRTERMAAGSGGTTLFPERQARVIQATQVRFADVLAVLAQGVATPGLRLDSTVPTAQHGIAVFTGRLRMRSGPVARRVELRVYPTQSSNLTVLELQPQRTWMPQTRRYLRAGVPAITDLTDRIERAAAAGERGR